MTKVTTQLCGGVHRLTVRKQEKCPGHRTSKSKREIEQIHYELSSSNLRRVVLTRLPTDPLGCNGIFRTVVQLRMSYRLKNTRLFNPFVVSPFGLPHCYLSCCKKGYIQLSPLVSEVDREMDLAKLLVLHMTKVTTQLCGGVHRLTVRKQEKCPGHRTQKHSRRNRNTDSLRAFFLQSSQDGSNSSAYRSTRLQWDFQDCRPTPNVLPSQEYSLV
ncbi:hypothetical protein AHF37_06007 [Paragonimus kellicotti]|nr:hypothetical protein AHF37_06007 [Paragonimus kellicotti]